MSETCKWLHEQLEPLPIFKYPFDLKLLPNNGVYFFHEEGKELMQISELRYGIVPIFQPFYFHKIYAVYGGYLNH